MCGRYTLATPADLITEHFDLSGSLTVESRYNIAPSQETLIVGTRRDGSRAAGFARWGLTAPSPGAHQKPSINARIETIHQKPTFRDSFARRRCLVPADGFYEWKATAHGKTPHYFQLRDTPVFAFAGIWNKPKTDDDPVTFAILTTEPNPIVSPIHARMPVILSRQSYDPWLARRELSRSEIELLATPYDALEMLATRVSSLVNSPGNDTAACIAPVGTG